MMQMKITIILPVYLFIYLFIYCLPLPIISIVFLKSQKTPKNFFFVLSLKLNFQEKWNLDLANLARQRVFSMIKMMSLNPAGEKTI